MITKQEVTNAAVKVCLGMRREWVPRDTGNMAFEALTITVTNNLIDITVDEEIAPYVPYTNEPWTSKKWNGKPNPNQGWWERFAAEFARRLTIELRGKLKVK